MDKGAGKSADNRVDKRVDEDGRVESEDGLLAASWSDGEPAGEEEDWTSRRRATLWLSRERERRRVPFADWPARLYFEAAQAEAAARDEEDTSSKLEEVVAADLHGLGAQGQGATRCFSLLARLRA